MKLSVTEKDLHLDQLWSITKSCYAGVELPDRTDFERFVRLGEVFVCGFPSHRGNWPFDDSIEGYALVDPTNITPLLQSIAVLPLFRGDGNGSVLLREVSNNYRSHGFQHVMLHCKTDNPAQMLYFREGYRVTAYLKNYYRPEGDGLEMRITL